MIGQIGRSGRTATGLGTITIRLASTLTLTVGAIAARTITTTPATSRNTEIRLPCSGMRPFGKTMVSARKLMYDVKPAQPPIQHDQLVPDGPLAPQQGSQIEVRRCRRPDEPEGDQDQQPADHVARSEHDEDRADRHVGQRRTGTRTDRSSKGPCR